MEVNFISKENDDVKFEIVFGSEEFENAQVKVYQRNKGSFAIDGFRKGKAPRKMIEQRYGEGVFMEDAVDDLLGSAYSDAITELDLDPIDQPRAEFSQIKKGEGFTVTITVAIEPVIEVKDYTGVTIKQLEYTVADEDVDKEIELAQTRASRMVETDRPAATDDTVNIDYEGKVDDIAFDGGTAQGHNLKLGSGSFIPGFEDQLIGSKKGDEIDVLVTFPDEYHSDELAGKEAVFHVKVNAVNEMQKPELDDDFAKDTSEFESMDEMRSSIREKLENAAVLRAENEMKNAVLEAVFNVNVIDLPEPMIESTMSDMEEEFAGSLQQQGLDYEQFLNYSGKTKAEFRESLKDDAIRRTMMRLIIKSVARAEAFEADDEEVNSELDKMAMQYGLETDKLREMLGENQIDAVKEDIKNRKAVDFMYESAVIETGDSESDDINKEDE